MNYEYVLIFWITGCYRVATSTTKVFINIWILWRTCDEWTINASFAQCCPEAKLTSCKPNHYEQHYTMTHDASTDESISTFRLQCLPLDIFLDWNAVPLTMNTFLTTVLINTLLPLSTLMKIPLNFRYQGIIKVLPTPVSSSAIGQYPLKLSSVKFLHSLLIYL